MASVRREEGLVEEEGDDSDNDVGAGWGGADMEEVDVAGGSADTGAAVV